MGLTRPRSPGRQRLRCAGRGGLGLSAFERARLAKSAGRTQKIPRVRVKLKVLFPSASLGLPAASVPAASLSAAAALPLATGGLVDADADPRSAPPRCFAPIRAVGKKTNLRRVPQNASHDILDARRRVLARARHVLFCLYFRGG